MERIHRHSMLSVPPTWFVKDDLFPISVSFSSLLFLPVELLFHLCIFLSFFLQSRSLHLSPKKHPPPRGCCPAATTLGKEVLYGDELMNFIRASWGKLSDCVSSKTRGACGSWQNLILIARPSCTDVADFVRQSSIQPYARGISRYRSVLIHARMDCLLFSRVIACV